MSQKSEAELIIERCRRTASEANASGAIVEHESDLVVFPPPLFPIASSSSSNTELMSKGTDHDADDHGNKKAKQDDESFALEQQERDRLRQEFSKAHISSMEQYRSMYTESISNPESFWSRMASDTSLFHWEKPWSHVCSSNFDLNKGPVSVEWFAGAQTNICYNAIDKNIALNRGDNVAFFWEGNNPSQSFSITYLQLKERVCRLANVLKSRGVQKGDSVAIYMPMIVELPVAMLACARIGAIHSVMFGGFSSEAIASRIVDGKCKTILTADGVYRGEKVIYLKNLIDKALDFLLKENYKIDTCIVYKHIGEAAHTNSTHWDPTRDLDWASVTIEASPECDPVWVDAEHPLFMIYTSGSTGKPKGVVHTTGGYMVYTALTFKYVFDYHPGDIYWSTSDCGWITGHSYVVYGPLVNGASSVLFEGIPTYPTAGRCWEIVDKYKVTQFYTAPTAIRSLMKFGDDCVKQHNRKSLRILGTVGEPINPSAWLWYHNVVGDGRCPIVDTWWQSETGGFMITPFPASTPLKPGSATHPFFGVVPAIVDQAGNELEGEAQGYLVIKQSWPGQMRTVFGDHKRFEDTYFEQFKGYYCTGDGCRRDATGYYWITGRIDDVLNVSGHRIGTAEVESAFVSHESVVEAAVVPMLHEIKGEAIYAYVTLKNGITWSDSLAADLKNCVREAIGAFATPDVIHNASALPKTRSGKIMRRILRKIANGETNLLAFGDISTLAEPQVVEQLIASMPKISH